MDRMGRPSLCGSKLMVWHIYSIWTSIRFRPHWKLGSVPGSESCHADGQRLSWADHWLSVAVAQEFWTGRCGHGVATFPLRPQ